MKRLASSYEFTDAELAAWVTWFLSPESGNEQLEKEVADSLQECLGAFFASAKAFEVHLAAKSKKQMLKRYAPDCKCIHGGKLLSSPPRCGKCNKVYRVEAQIEREGLTDEQVSKFLRGDIDPMERG